MINSVVCFTQNTQLTARFIWDRIVMEYTHDEYYYEGWNFNSGNYLFTTDTK